MARRSTPLVTLAALLATLSLAAPAAAHADLMSAEPTPNTELDAAPQTLVLDFSEPLEDTYTSIQLLDADGDDHVEGFTIPDDDRDRLDADIAPLDDGVYTVRWQALSSSDGHTTSGSYLLGVNASLADTETPTPGTDDPDTSNGDTGQEPVGEGGPGEALLRGLAFLGGSLAAGTPLFTLLAHGTPLPSTLRSRWTTAATAGAALATIASIGLIAALAGRIETPLQATLATTPGENLLLRALAFLAAAVLLIIGWHERGHEHAPAFTAAGTLAALTGLLITSLGSHAAADGVGTGLAIAVDWAHQAAVAFWVSGVAALALAGLSDTPEETGARLIRRFSPLAVASVAAIVITGIWASLDRLTTPADLIESLYGFALSAKILLLVPLLGLGAYHRYRLLPQLETPGHEERDVSRLRRSALLELGLMIVVLVAAGFMATTSPPTPPEEAAPYATFDEAYNADTLDPLQPDLEASQLTTLSPDEAANTTLKLLVPTAPDELPTGDQPVWVLLAHETGDEPEPIPDATLEMHAWMPQHGHGTNQPETDPQHVHQGMYEGATHWMMPGAWELRFNVTLSTGDTLHYAPTLWIQQQADPLDTLEPHHAFSQDGYDVDLYVTPDEPVRVGFQNLTVRVTPLDGTYPTNADVVVNAQAPGSSGEGTSLEMDRWREDAWTLEDAIFTEPGDWRLLIAFQGQNTYLQDEATIPVQPR